MAKRLYARVLPLKPGRKLFFLPVWLDKIPLLRQEGSEKAGAARCGFLRKRRSQKNLPTYPLKQQARAQSTQAEGRVSESLHPFIRHGGSGRVCGATAGTGCRRGRGPAELQLENRHFER